MTAGTEVLGKRPIRGQEALRLPCGLEPLHAPLSLTGGLVRVFGPIVQVGPVAL